MEEKKFDLNSIIGFVLIFGIMMWIMYQNKPTEAEIKAEKAKKEQVEKTKVKTQETTELTAVAAADSTQLKALQSTLGSFAYSASLPSAKNEFTTLENELVTLKIANKGGYIAEATLKNFKSIDDKGPLVQLVKNNNAQLNLALQTKEGKALNTKDLFFEPVLTKVDGNQVLSMKLKAGENSYLEYKYVLKPNDYMLDFNVRSQGLASVLNTSNPVNLNWDFKAYRNEKSVKYENTYTEAIYEYEDGKDSSLNKAEKDEEDVADLTYVAFKQHFFTSVLLTEKPVKAAKLTSENLVKDDAVDTTFTKQFKASLPLAFSNGELDYKMNWYYGPADYKILNAYDRNLDELIPLGWGIFGWINKFIFVPLFGLISSFLPFGIAIILFTVLIKLAMSPFTYKSFLSQAKMKVLRPELNEINDKFKDPVKRQQETMKLYNKAGVNPMAGCVPALIQLPFMYASFQFFPSALELRQQGFLWAKDLSSYDSIFELPFNIPLYGDHVSLFPILAAIAIFFYMKYTTGDQAMSAPPQEGMPDMSKIMKMMIWISPVMMLIFFNNYGSGLSLYNLFSNLMTLGLMFYIKRFLVDDAKIHAQIQENKLKEPKKPGKFQQKLQEAMEQAEAQKKARGNK
ncbi:membrane protein insertase YidC [Flavobacterium sp. H122]|uniref:membrane protein insertase YidC n=1 Tax=Flavobacterium sp. H122 TaxID=2529860 RepID=UPI0010AAE22F|nr:membrane protein insertase YidC [Flavobacterium sp. H122]